MSSQVKLAFMDDRKTKMLRDEIEKEHRAARAAAQAAAQAEQQSEAVQMHGGPPLYEAGDE